MGYYFLASLVPMGISLLLSPVYAMHLSPEDYAIIGFYDSFNALLYPLILFFLNQYYMREYFYRDENGKKQLRAMIYKAFIVFPFILMIISLIGLYIYMSCFNKESSIPFLPYAVLSLFPSALAGLYRLELIDCKVERRGKDYFILSVFSSTFIALCSVLFVVTLEWGALGRMLGLLICPFVLFLWALIRHRDLMNVTFDWKQFKDAIIFCLPLVIAAMLGFFSNGYDKVSLEKIVPLNQLGFYSIGITIAGYLSVFSTAISDTFSPDIFESLAQKNVKKMLKYLGLQLVVMLVIVLLFIICARFLIMFFTANRYLEATPYARIASLGAITTLLYNSMSSIVLSYKKTKVLLYTKIIGSLLCIVSYYLLIKYFTLKGAAWGMVLSNVYFTIFTLLFLVISIRRDNKSAAKVQS
ncbi:MAG: oligosaccharide flippase family protein [Eubacteriales bacterium]|nr:oligosaccharide flippase family protein [Eubacteriales bacterium]